MTLWKIKWFLLKHVQMPIQNIVDKTINWRFYQLEKKLNELDQKAGFRRKVVVSVQFRIEREKILAKMAKTRNWRRMAAWERELLYK